MEKKKLNFNKPLLSVRRPPYQSQVKSGPVGKPAAVPFQWEQIPGRPKLEITSPQALPPLTPKPPPGRHLNAKLHHSPSTRDNMIPGVNFPRSRSLDESIKDLEMISGKGAAEENRSCDSGDRDAVAFVDALDTLTRTQSFFLNCSLSSLIGIDDLPTNTGGSFSSDPQSREILMDRFLPAAKALVEGTPRNVPKRQSAVRQPPQGLKKIVDSDKPDPPFQHSFAKLYSDYVKNGGGKEDVSDDDCESHENLGLFCGLLPRFCLRSSVGLTDPLPATKARTRASPSHGNKIQPRGSSDGSYSKFVNEVTTIEKDEMQQSESCGTLIYHDAAPSFIEDNSGEMKIGGINSPGFSDKGIKTFRELLADGEDSDAVDSVVEKTVYVDTVQDVGSIKSQPGDATQEDNVVNTKRIDPSEEDIRKSNAARKAATLLLNSTSTDAANGKREEVANALRPNQDLTTTDIKVVVTTNLGKQRQRTLSDLPLPPPLPKSPSDSWLWRTLPSLSGKNAVQHTYLGAARNPHGFSFKATAGNATMAKWTEVQRQRSRHSEA